MQYTFQYIQSYLQDEFDFLPPGDYMATAKACQVANPPLHAINRGIAMEGLSSLYGSLAGVCHATTSYSNIIGLISFTGVSFS